MKYTINDYIKELSNYGQIIGFSNINNGEKVIHNLTYNSKNVKDNSMFVCKGANFNPTYLYEAINKGAVVYVSENEFTDKIPSIIVKDIQKSLSVLSNMYFNYPSNSLNVIGITGTKGKSTTAYYIKNILDMYRLNRGEKETAIMSSIDTYDGINRFESHITTPESYELNEHLYNAVNSGIKDMVMEVSSQALKYDRVYTLKYNYGVFLNIGIDHISRIEHDSFEDYFESKLKIFDRINVSFVNMDSDFYERIKEEARKSKKYITFSKKNPDAEIYAYDIRKLGQDTLFKVRCGEFDTEFALSMPGLFNIENALAAIGVTYAMGVPLEIIKEGIYNAKASGRMELFTSDDNKISVLVDYAHNKLSFEKLYESVKSEYPEYRIVTIFGCPGGKAYIRREHLGTLAGINSDKIILTSEDPGKESVIDICNDILKYVIKYNDNCEIIETRADAIKSAIEEASQLDGNTIILFTGKGRETREKVGESYIDCISDVEYAKMFLKEYNEMKKKIKKI